MIPLLLVKRQRRNTAEVLEPHDQSLNDISFCFRDFILSTIVVNSSAISPYEISFILSPTLEAFVRERPIFFQTFRDRSHTISSPQRGKPRASDQRRKHGDATTNKFVVFPVGDGPRRSSHIAW